jgi:hypothetical protein
MQSNKTSWEQFEIKFIEILAQQNKEGAETQN